MVIIVKLTNRCNLHCKYCSVKAQSKGIDLSINNYKNFLCKVKNIYKRNILKNGIEIIWHGGEPTLIKPNIFKKFIETTNNIFYFTRINYSMQTNAFSIKNSFIKYCKEYEIKIGASLDGDENCNRTTKTKTLKIIENIKKYKLPILMVVSKINIKHQKNIFKLFTNISKSFKINPIYKSGRAEENWEKLRLEKLEYSHFLINFFKYIIEHNILDCNISPINDLIKIYYGIKPNACIFNKMCIDNFLEINQDGSICPCGRLSEKKEFYISKDVENFNIENINKIRQKYIERLNNLKNNDCKDCKFFLLCYGGCPAESNLSFYNKTYYCLDYLNFIEFFKNEGEKMLLEKLYEYEKDKKEIKGLLQTFKYTKINFDLGKSLFKITK